MNCVKIHYILYVGINTHTLYSVFLLTLRRRYGMMNKTILKGE